MNLFIYLSLEIWILVTEICLEIEDIFKFDSFETNKGKTFFLRKYLCI